MLTRCCVVGRTGTSNRRLDTLPTTCGGWPSDEAGLAILFPRLREARSNILPVDVVPSLEKAYAELEGSTGDEISS